MMQPLIESQMDLLVSQYLQLLEPQYLCFPPNNALLRPAVQQLIYQRMFDETLVWPIPPPGYRIRVLKMLISKLEKSISNTDEDEVLDDLMRSYSDLISCPRLPPFEEAQKLSYIRYTAPKASCGRRNDQFVITLENRNLILASRTTGFRTWEAALHLGTYLTTPEGRSLIEEKNVVELGSGTGLLSMYCLKCLGARRVTATDRDPALISSIKDCAIRNDLSRSRIDAEIWEWGTPLQPNQPPSSKEPYQSFDVALGADLIYDMDLVPLLLSTLRELFDKHGIKVFIISAALRNPETFNDFLKKCARMERFKLSSGRF
ncbi:methyltransferase domain-containing protein [Histoplasma capsulatum var. duboisii H88]|uniref:Methyltransferase domain-containing protein n=1 Tax=Ajellomyces capsulatus (strain H88) TaxID=544711 RepID=A0A8A1LRD8_AJEC8|nr:methyltransferase domain-containing protein [Histoplasma capsulatum var. duboisii H88]